MLGQGLLCSKGENRIEVRIGKGVIVEDMGESHGNYEQKNKQSVCLKFELKHGMSGLEATLYLFWNNMVFQLSFLCQPTLFTIFFLPPVTGWHGGLAPVV